MSNSKKVFIIGNGFDLDLGWNTRYSDFAKSQYWPHKDFIYPSDLQRSLQEKAEFEKWFDLEQALSDYASIPSNNLLFPAGREGENPYLQEDKHFFETMSASLMQYLQNEQTTNPIKKDSIAIKVLKAIINNGYFTSIYSFNYTDLNIIATKAGIPPIQYEHVHGNLKNRSIILGVEDNVELKNGYSFLYKTFNRHYESHPIQYDLLDADEVVFFGHSLGINDYHYFQRFFQQQCDEHLERKDGKDITIITYNEASRISILEQLRRMNNKRTDQLFLLNRLQFICTADGETGKLDKFLKHLEDDSEATHQKQLLSLASMIH